ncbi:MAG: hypothetical protein DRQ58_10045 [Gammaproteobacteria bacterium]|nr:MAG: hypothetical protein DRQ58_10045 [Gammaproteobacteria bacterium]
MNMKTISLLKLKSHLNVFWIVLVAGLVSHPVNAEIPEPGPDVGEQTRATLMNFTKFLSSQKSFSYTAEMGYEAVQNSGLRIEFGATRKVTVQRPNRARIEAQRRDGGKRLVIIDGKEISVFDENENVYAIVPREGTLSEIIDYYVDELEMPLPLAELASDDLSEVLTENISFGHTIGESTISGILCDNLVLQNDEVDIQLWIAKGKKPLPRRVVITYKNEPGEPQFWATFVKWDLSPDVDDKQFTFKPPADANRITFAPRLAVIPGGAE